MEPLITIGILNMNGLKRLKKVLPSYLNQEYPNTEIVVVDNGSTDGSIEFLEKFTQITIIKNKTNLGYGKGKNILVNSSKGKYILMLDNDVELTQNDFLAHIYREYIKLKNPAFVTPLIKSCDKDRVGIGLFHSKMKKTIELDSIYKKGILKIPSFNGTIVFFKKEIFSALGCFDEIYPINIDDYDLSARAYLSGYDNYLTTNLLAIHHGIENRANIQNICWRNQYYLSGFSRMIWKNYSFVNLLIWWPISSIRIFYKFLKQSIKLRSLCILTAYFKSFYFFLRDLPSTMTLRKNIQLNRVIKKDIFLKIPRLQFIKR